MSLDTRRRSTFRCLLGLAVSVSLADTSSVAFAACSGASSPEALQAFNANPVDFIAAHGNAPDIGAQMSALAAAAVNSRDAAFGKNLGAALGKASGDQGSAIGKALGSIGTSCTDPLDPSNRADKSYISTNIAPNVLTNVAANTAYGQAADSSQTASTGAPGGGGAAGAAAAGGAAGIGGQTGSPAAATSGGGGGGVDPSPSTSTANPQPTSAPLPAGSPTASTSPGLNGATAVSSN